MSEPEGWVPVRYVNAAQKCRFCGVVIEKGSPGRRTGERGTKAWWNRYDAARGIPAWECLACRTEGFRAEEARRDMDARRGAESGRRCDA